MKVYGWISYLILLLISLYTIGFAWKLLREEKNKIGFLFTLIVALSLLVIPLYFYR